MVDKKKESNGDHLSATGHLDKLDWLCCGTVFAFSLFSALLLSLAYPEGLTNPQTTMFFDVQSRFQILGHNSLDWICLYPYGGVLALGSAAGNPAWASYWLNNLLFSLNSALVFLLLRALFSARLLSFSMALMAVLIEFVSMRMFFYHLILSADALFGETVYLALLLALNSWLNCWRPMLFISCAFFGLASVIKPIGMVLLPLWGCFSIVGSYKSVLNQTRRMVSITFCFLLLFAPTAIWSVRNYFVYGYAKVVGVSGVGLLSATLPLLKPGDQVLADPKSNAEFIKAVQDNELVFFSSRDWNKEVANNTRMNRYEFYLFCGKDLTGPFDYLAGLKNPSERARWGDTYSNSDKMFAIDKKAMDIAVRIVWAHPFAYLGSVWTEYQAMFSPLQLLPAPWEDFQSDPQVAYVFRPDWGLNCDPSTYGKRGKPDPGRSNLQVAALIGALLKNSIVQSMLNFYYASQLVLAHMIFLGAIAAPVLCRVKTLPVPMVKTVDRVAITLIMLFLTVAAQYLATALCEIARTRYQIGCGDLEIHLLVLIGLVSIIVALIDWCRKQGKIRSLERAKPL